MVLGLRTEGGTTIAPLAKAVPYTPVPAPTPATIKFC